MLVTSAWARGILDNPARVFDEGGRFADDGAHFLDTGTGVVGSGDQFSQNGPRWSDAIARFSDSGAPFPVAGGLIAVNTINSGGERTGRAYRFGTMAMVQRDTHTSRPCSSLISIDHTCDVLPT